MIVRSPEAVNRQGQKSAYDAPGHNPVRISSLRAFLTAWKGNFTIFTKRTASQRRGELWPPLVPVDIIIHNSILACGTIFSLTSLEQYSGSGG